MPDWKDFCVPDDGHNRSEHQYTQMYSAFISELCGLSDNKHIPGKFELKVKKSKSNP
jgi:hypothetical protein